MPALLLFFCLPPAWAGTATWSGTTDGNWGTAANWGGTLPTFNNTLDVTLTGAANPATFLGAARIIKSLNFDANADADFNIRLSTTATSGTANLSFGAGSGQPAINIDSGATGNHQILAGGNVVLLANLVVNHAGPANFIIGRPITGAFSVTKYGSGKLILNGANAFSGGLNVNAGTLGIYSQNASIMGAGMVTFADGVTLNHVNTAALTPTSPLALNGDITVSGGINLTLAGAMNLGTGTRQITAAVSFAISGAITNTGGLIKSGAGTLTLSGASTYTGGTTVANGKLLVNGSIQGASASVQNGATLGGSGLINGSVSVAPGGILAPGGSDNVTGTLTIANNLFLTNATLQFDLTNASSADKIVVGGSLLLEGVTTVSLGNPALLADGYYTLIETTGALGGNYTNFSVTSPSSGKIYTIVYEPGLPNKVRLQVASGFAGLLWQGGVASNAWDNDITVNWLNLVAGVPSVFLDNDPVLFDDTGAANSDVQIPVTVSPSSVFVNSSSNYLFSGAAGIGGTSPLTKAGSGTLTLAGVNAYTGGTTVSNGILAVNGSLGLSAVMVAGGTLAGNGVLVGPVSVAGGGTLAPGAPSGGGNLGFGTLTANGTVNLAGTTVMEISWSGLGLTNDQLVCGGTLTYGGILTVNNAVNLAGGESFKLFSATGYSGNFSATNLPALASGLEWIWTPANGTLSVGGSNNPVCALKGNFSHDGGGFHLALNWPADYRGWVLQSNSVSLADPNSWFDVPGSAGATNLDWVMANPSAQNVFYRLHLAAAVTRLVRPNVLFIIMDDLTTTLGSYGDPDARTPRMDALAASGVRFDRAFTQFSLCNPSRSSLLTGYYPERTKIYNLVDSFRDALPEAVTLPQLFKNAGYITGRIGKVFHVFDPNTVNEVEIGAPLDLDGTILDEVKLAQRTEGDTTDLPQTNANGVVSYNRPYGASTEPANNFTDFSIASNAIVTLDAFKDKPFFLAVGFIRPHTPWVAPAAFFNWITGTNLIAMPAYYQPGGESLAGIPFSALRPNNNAFGSAAATLDQAREGHRAYLAAASFSDSQMGRVLDQLQELNLDTNTIVVLTGDHGYQLGEHGLWAKQTLFYEGRHIPFMIRAPGMATGVCTGLVEQLDIYPTLAELAGIPAPAGIQGVSLVPNLVNPSAPGKAASFSVMESTTNTRFMGYSVSNDRYSYIEWGPDGIGGHQLYDHQTDLHELTNLADVPAYAGMVADLRTQLTNHIATASAP